MKLSHNLEKKCVKVALSFENDVAGESLFSYRNHGERKNLNIRLINWQGDLCTFITLSGQNESGRRWRSAEGTAWQATESGFCADNY